MQCDFYGDSTVFMMPCSGVDGSKPATELKGKGLTYTGDAALTVAEQHSGGSSLYLSGAGHVYSPKSSDFDFGTGDFTIEFWLFAAAPLSSMGDAGVVGNKFDNGTGGWQFYRNSSSNPNGLTFRAAAQNDYAFVSPVVVGVWEHYCAEREAGTLKLYKNGTLDATYPCTQSIAESTGYLNIGKLQSFPDYWSGYMDDLRITKGAARYSGTFTPPVSLTTVVQCVVAGLVTEEGVAVSRRIRLYDRGTADLVSDFVSGLAGDFSVKVRTNGPFFVVALDDPSGAKYNAVIVDNIVPDGA